MSSVGLVEEEEEVKNEKDDLYLLNDIEGMNTEESIRTNLTKDTVIQWHVDDVVEWATKANHCTTPIINCLQMEGIDGQALLSLTEDDIRDFRYRCHYDLRCGEMKRFWHIVRNLQISNTEHHHNNCKAHHRLHTYSLGYMCCNNRMYNHHLDNPASFNDNDNCLADNCSVVDGCATNIPPEFSKTAISLGYSFLVTWITSFVMVIVHERVPDMKRYPPLPDIFLDNVPHIPWAFHMCEVTGTLLFIIWAIVCIFHKYRMVILRRFFALAGTVFLLRCVTMLITSLSVPGTHLQCNKNDYAIDDTVFTLTEALYLRISRAYTIWSGLGMSIQGVRTCGDYMFSGHTVALTLLNFFITEYTPRNLYFLHTLSWLLNMFGIFFILAAHEHYSIDVFVAFYITSRLFLYYHTLANNQALMQRDSNRTRIWFPMFSYFESSVNGIIPNEYESIDVILNKILGLLVDFKNLLLQTVNRLWLEAPALPIVSYNGFSKMRDNSKALLHNVTTSTSQLRLKSISAIKMESWSSESLTVTDTEHENFNNSITAAQLDSSISILKPVIKTMDSTTSDTNKQSSLKLKSKEQLEELCKLRKDGILCHSIKTNSNSTQNAILPASRFPASPDVSKKFI